LPWTSTLDLNVAYAPSWVEGLQFKVDVFNVLNSSDAITVNEFGEDAAGNPQAGGVYGAGHPRAGQRRGNLYGTATDWQEPRWVRLMVQYDF